MRTETRIYVKILFSENGKSQLANVLYFRNEMTLDFFIRWEWVFKYRAALQTVKYPKSFVLYEHGPYQYELPEDKYIDKVKNRYLADKRQLTKFRNKLENVKLNWNELFPIEESPHYNRVIAKLNYYENQYIQSKQEYNQIIK